MNDDLHNEDEHFRNAYRNYEEEPSPEVWDKISARLDNDYAIYYRRKYAFWMRFACALLLLLAGIGIYEISEHAQTHPTAKSAYTSQAALPANGLVKTPDRAGANNVVANKNNHAKTYRPYAASTVHSGRVYHGGNMEQGLHSQSVDQQQSHLPLLQTTLLLRQSRQKQDGIPPRARIALAEQPTNAIEEGVLPSAEAGEKNLAKSESEGDQPIAKKDSVNFARGRIHLHTFTNDSSAFSIVTAKKDALKTKKSWEILPYASLDFTHYYLDNDVRENGSNTSDKNDIEGNEKHESSYSAGILAKWHFSKKLALQTGLVYSNIAIGIQPQTLFATRDNNQHTAYKFITSSGFAYVKPLFGTAPSVGDSIRSDLGQHRLNYAGLPAMITYPMLNKKRLSLLTSAGVNANLLLSTKIETGINHDINKQLVIINKLIGLRPMYFSFIADAELQYHINKHISATMLPVVKFAFTSQTKNYIVKTYPYSLCLGAGVTYHF